MGKAKEDWWRSAKEMLKRYPRIKREHDDLHQQRLTVELTGMPRGGGTARGTEMIALLQLPSALEKEYQDITDALQITKTYPDGEIRAKLIELTYFKHGGIKMEHAAYKANISYATAKRWHKEFMYLLAKLHGWRN